MKTSATTTTPRGPWVEYAIEAGGLGLFMLSAAAFGTLLEHPASPVHAAIASAFVRRVVMGLAMAATAVMLIYSPWGRRSGAHFNPAVTLTFFLLGKVSRRDAAGYAFAQFLGGLGGILVAGLLLGPALGDPAVNYVATQPGPAGDAVAFVAEYAMTALLMTVVLAVSSRPAVAPYTGWCAAACVALFITFEAPLSGMSLNPARTLASALAAGDWSSLWIYFTAPPLGMLFAAALHTHAFTRPRTACAKLHHDPAHRCLFCEHQQAVAATTRE